MNQPQQKEAEALEVIKSQNALLETILKLSQLSMPLVLSALIPWGSWMTYKVITFEEWKNQGPRWTQKDADALELKVKDSIYSRVDSKLEDIRKEIVGQGKDLIDLKLLLKEHETKTAQMLKATTTMGGQP